MLCKTKKIYYNLNNYFTYYEWHVLQYKYAHTLVGNIYFIYSMTCTSFIEILSFHVPNLPTIGHIAINIYSCLSFILYHLRQLHIINHYILCDLVFTTIIIYCWCCCHLAASESTQCLGRSRVSSPLHCVSLTVTCYVHRRLAMIIVYRCHP